MLVTETAARPVPDLGSAVRSLGAATIEALHVPAAAASPRRLVMHDPLWPQPPGAGDVLLAVGLRADEFATADLVDRAGAAGAAAVVVRAASPLACPVDMAARSGVALLRATPHLPWQALHAQLAAALRLGRSEDSELRGGSAGLNALLDAAAAIADADVALLDVNLGVVAYSEPRDARPDPLHAQAILERGLPRANGEALASSGLLRRLWSVDEVVPIGDAMGAGAGHHHAVAVRDRGEVLGLLWAATRRTRLTAAGARALQRAATFAPGCANGLRGTVADDPLGLDGALRALLDGSGVVAPELERCLGLEAGQPMAVLAVRHLSTGNGAVPIRRVARVVAATATALQPRSAQIADGDTVHLLVGGASAVRPERLRAFATRLRWEVERAVGGRVLVGVGDAVERLAAVHRSRAEAEIVVRVLERRQTGGAATLAMVSAEALIDELCVAMAEHDDLRLTPLHALVDHPELLRTLRGYLDAFGDVGQAAGALHIHPNTLRYRLRRVSELAPLDLDSPAQRALVGIQLRALQVAA